jgi:hypothetical protein
VALTQSLYRFGVDELAESTHGWLAAENTNPSPGTPAPGVTFLLRFCVQANATGLTNVDNEFQCRKNGGAWQNITTSSTIVRAVAAAAFADGANCTKRLSGTGTFESSAAGCTEDGISGGTANDIVASGCSETECGLQIQSADVANGDVIDFRLTRDGGTLLDAYSVTPSITISVAATGTLSVTSADTTISATGAVAVVGALSATSADTTISATVAVAVTGTLSATSEATALSATGTVEDSGVTGTLSVTSEDTALSSAGTVTVTGTLTATSAETVLSSTGTVVVVGSTNITCADSTLASTGAVAVVGTLSATSTDATLTATGAVSIAGQLAVTCEDGQLSATGAALVTGSLDVTSEDSTLAATATGQSVSDGVLDITCDDTTLTATAAVDVTGTLSVTSADTSVTATGAVLVTGTLTITCDDSTIEAGDGPRIQTLPPSVSSSNRVVLALSASISVVVTLTPGVTMPSGYIAGFTAVLALVVTDPEDGAAIDADAVQATVTEPDGTTTLLEYPADIETTGTGLYEVAFETSQRGRHSVTWTATTAGGVSVSDPERFYVRAG